MENLTRQSSLSDESQKAFEELGFISGSPKVLSVLQQARKAAEVSDVTVLLEGETGTGKQVLARAIRQLDRKHRSFPFITLGMRDDQQKSTRAIQHRKTRELETNA
jgi:DNA-binding NtrC family response regulator